MAPARRGFTLIELMLALVLVAVAVLATLAIAALVTRMIARAERASAAATFAGQRLERLRASGCAAPVPGSEVRYRGRAAVDSHAWRFVDLGNGHWRVVLTTSHLTERNRWRRDSLETEISCRF